ncbi:MAG TPA: hypothetical protein VF002_00010 [Gaiellaceae bacterium]
MAAKLTTLPAFTATLVLCGTLDLVVATPAPAGGPVASAAPAPLSPRNGARLDQVPPFAWSLVGAGVRAQPRKTKIWGAARFTLRPSRRGRVLFTAKKSGFQQAGITLRVW